MVPTGLTGAGRQIRPHAAIEDNADARFVNKEEYFRLLVGFRRLVRADDAEKNLRGLLDEETGTRYMIHEEELITAFPAHANA